jgi:hypothetical protein
MCVKKERDIDAVDTHCKFGMSVCGYTRTTIICNTQTGMCVMESISLLIIIYIFTDVVIVNPLLTNISSVILSTKSSTMYTLKPNSTNLIALSTTW